SLAEDEQSFKTVIRHVPNFLQRPQTNISSKKQETNKFRHNSKQSELYTEYDLGRALPVLHDPYWINSENVEVSREANTISFSTSEAVGEIDSNVRDKISSISSCNQCDVEVRVTENPQCLIWGDTNRLHKDQTRNVKPSTEQRPFESSSPPTR
ncbi:4189_t:CDS:2, partial [Funneliformis geosporum]